MTIEHVVEIALILVPTALFIIFLLQYKTKKGELPSSETGGRLIFRSFEGATALALLLSVAFQPDLVVKLGEFRGLLAALATHAAWVAFITIRSEMK